MENSNALMMVALLTLVDARFVVAPAGGATITVEFEPAPGVTPDYNELLVEIGDLSKPGAWKNATKRVAHEATFKETFNVSTGTYLVRVFTGPADEMSVARPGAFYTHPMYARLANDSSSERFVF